MSMDQKTSVGLLERLSQEIGADDGQDNKRPMYPPRRPTQRPVDYAPEVQRRQQELEDALAALHDGEREINTIASIVCGLRFDLLIKVYNELHPAVPDQERTLVEYMRFHSWAMDRVKAQVTKTVPDDRHRVASQD